MDQMDTVLINYDKILGSTGNKISTGATLFEIDSEEKWIPNSLIYEHFEKSKQIEIPEWFAKKEDLI